MRWSIDIEKIQNGFIVSWQDQYEDNDLPFTKYQVFEFDDDDEKSEYECLKRMFLFIAEHFNMQWSKHNPYNIDIKVIKKDD